MIGPLLLAGLCVFADSPGFSLIVAFFPSRCDKPLSPEDIEDEVDSEPEIDSLSPRSFSLTVITAITYTF